jgi:hypothetical protein
MVSFGLLLRECPSCKRRFGVKLLSQKIADSQEELPGSEMPKPHWAGDNGSLAANPTALSGAPLVPNPGVERVVRQYTILKTYQCKNCGHEWSEKHLESQDEGPQ